MLTRVGVPVELEAEPSAPGSEPTTLVCFSHLRWNFVFQRPQHLLSLLASEWPVIFWEEPIFETVGFAPCIETHSPHRGVTVVVPHLPQGLDTKAGAAELRALLDDYL